jgi:hypothetical protein
MLYNSKCQAKDFIPEGFLNIPNKYQLFNRNGKYFTQKASRKARKEKSRRKEYSGKNAWRCSTMVVARLAKNELKRYSGGYLYAVILLLIQIKNYENYRNSSRFNTFLYNRIKIADRSSL